MATNKNASTQMSSKDDVHQTSQDHTNRLQSSTNPQLILTNDSFFLSNSYRQAKNIQSDVYQIKNSESFSYNIRLREKDMKLIPNIPMKPKDLRSSKYDKFITKPEGKPVMMNSFIFSGLTTRDKFYRHTKPETSQTTSVNSNNVSSPNFFSNPNRIQESPDEKIVNKDGQTSLHQTKAKLFQMVNPNILTEVQPLTNINRKILDSQTSRLDADLKNIESFNQKKHLTKQNTVKKLSTNSRFMLEGEANERGISMNNSITQFKNHTEYVNHCNKEKMFNLHFKQSKNLQKQNIKKLTQTENDQTIRNNRIKTQLQRQKSFVLSKLNSSKSVVMKTEASQINGNPEMKKIKGFGKGDEAKLNANIPMNPRLNFILVICFDRVISRLSTLKHGFFQRQISLNQNKFYEESKCIELTQVFIGSVQNKMGLGKSYQFMYTRDGKKINSIINFAAEDWVLLLSSLPEFEGRFNKKTDIKGLQDINTPTKNPCCKSNQISNQCYNYNEFIDNLYDKIEKLEARYSKFFSPMLNGFHAEHIDHQPIEKLIRVKYRKEIRKLVKQALNGENIYKNPEVEKICNKLLDQNHNKYNYLNTEHNQPTDLNFSSDSLNECSLTSGYSLSSSENSSLQGLENDSKKKHKHKGKLDMNFMKVDFKESDSSDTKSQASKFECVEESHVSKSTSTAGNSELFVHEGVGNFQPDLTNRIFGNQDTEYLKQINLVCQTYELDSIREQQHRYKILQNKVEKIYNKINWNKQKLTSEVKNEFGDISMKCLKKILRSKLLDRQLDKEQSHLSKSADSIVNLVRNINKGMDNDYMDQIPKKPTDKQKSQKNVFKTSQIGYRQATDMDRYICAQEQVAERKTHLTTQKDYYISQVNLNIPKMSKLTSFRRKELHDYYTLFKALVSSTSQRYGKNGYEVKRGIDFESFRNGMFYIFIQSQNISRRMFQQIVEKFSDFLDWPRFLKAMKMIRAKSLPDKLDLFIKMADENGDGNLSMKEVFELCQDCLDNLHRAQTVKSDVSDNKDLAEYFAKVIFQACKVNVDDEISLSKIKECIYSGHPDADLLCMVCGADV